MTKTLNQIISFFLHQNQNIFSSNIGNQNIFLELLLYSFVPVGTYIMWNKYTVTKGRRVFVISIADV
jgi:hypothetical protein